MLSMSPKRSLCMSWFFIVTPIARRGKSFLVMFGVPAPAHFLFSVLIPLSYAVRPQNLAAHTGETPGPIRPLQGSLTASP